MKLIFKIAWRNIWRHKGKSIIIGIILFIGAFLMTLGNAVISGMDYGMEKNIVNMFTGDIVIMSDKQEKDNILFDVMEAKPVEVIENYFELKDILQKTDFVQKFLPAAVGFVLVFSPETDMGDTFAMGIDIEAYQKMFPDNMKIVEGDMLSKNQKGAMVSEELRKRFYDYIGFWIKTQGNDLNRETLTEDAKAEGDNLLVKDELVVMGISTSNSTLDVKLDVKGVYKFNALNKIWGYYTIMDIESFREIHNYVTGEDNLINISDEQKNIIESDDFEDLFKNGDILEEKDLSGDAFSLENISKQTKRDEANNINIDSGAYNIVFLKLKDNKNPEKYINQLNDIFKSKGIKARAVSWKKAVGTIGSMASIIRGALGIFIGFIFFVAIIVIMNTLSMAAIERTSEIAMMRAIGSKKWFISKMMIVETWILSFAFGFIGIVFGIIIILILKNKGITSENEFVQILFGGDTLNPIITIKDIVKGIIDLSIVTLLAVLYPIKIAKKIVPLDAIARD